MSLRLKMIFGIGAILLSVTLVYALIALRSQAKYRQDLALHQADLIAAMADRSLARAMGFGETEVIRAILARIGEQSGLTGIRIVAADGRVLQSSRPEKSADAPRREWTAGSHPSRRGISGRSVGVFRPIPNGPACVGCTGRPKDSRILNVSCRSESGIGHLHQWTIVIIAAVISSCRGRPHRALFSPFWGAGWTFIATMGRVEGGDLSVRVEVSTTS
jgi:hypothetical protein